VHFETLETDKLTRGTSLKLAHLGDLHIERLTSREKKILQTLEEQKPDLILFSGDIQPFLC
jgi:predicted MPP superfamily phosphohydrolase